MQPGPCRLVAPQAQFPLQSDRAGAIFLARHRPHRPKPNRQRFACVLEDCPSRHRALITATRTLQQYAPHRPVFSPITTGTTKPIWPPQPDQKIPAGCFRRKARLKFSQISGVILHGRPYYILGSPESSKYPIPAKLGGLWGYSAWWAMVHYQRLFATSLTRCSIHFGLIVGDSETIGAVQSFPSGA